MARTKTRICQSLFTLVLTVGLLAAAISHARAQGIQVQGLPGLNSGLPFAPKLFARKRDNDRGPSFQSGKDAGKDGPRRGFGSRFEGKSRRNGGASSAGQVFDKDARGWQKGDRSKNDPSNQNVDDRASSKNRLGRVPKLERDAGDDNARGSRSKRTRDASDDSPTGASKRGRDADSNKRKLIDKQDSAAGKADDRASTKRIDPKLLNQQSGTSDVGRPNRKPTGTGMAKTPLDPNGRPLQAATGGTPTPDPKCPSGNCGDSIPTKPTYPMPLPTGDGKRPDPKCPSGNCGGSIPTKPTYPMPLPTGDGDGPNPPCRGPNCDGAPTKPPYPLPTGGGDGPNPPCRGPNCDGAPTKPPYPLPTGGGDGPNPPCRGPNCDGAPTKPPYPLPTGGGDGDGTPPSNPPYPTPLPTGDPDCRGRNCGGGGDQPNDPDCRRRGGCDGPGRPHYPRPRPPVIIVTPGFPSIPPGDYGDVQPEPTYAPSEPVPTYDPARPREPARQVNRTPPPSPPPPPAAFATAAAPLPVRRDYLAERPQFRPNELLITVQGAQPDAIAGQVAQNFNLVLQESQAFVLLEDRRIYRFSIPDNRDVPAVVAAVANAPGVEQSSPNFLYFVEGTAAGKQPTSTNSLQYALSKLHVSDTQDLASGRGVTVAVINSGVDTGHPDLKQANIAFYDAIDGGVKDPDRHGTAIAGIIAGRGDVNGVAPGVKMLAVRAFAPDRLGLPPSTSSMALSRAIDTGFARGARVFNMSFAGPRDPLVLSLIDAAYDKGAVFIAAAGNAGPTAPPAYPAAYDRVIGITATDEDDGIYTMANRGAYISIAAPGVDILAPVTGNALDYMSGTSFAAAHISGVVALLLERNPTLSPYDIRIILSRAAQDLGETGRDDEFGAGLANAYDALVMASSPKVQSSINP